MEETQDCLAARAALLETRLPQAEVMAEAFRQAYRPQADPLQLPEQPVRRVQVFRKTARLNEK